jgi:hypothetical protein
VKSVAKKTIHCKGHGPLQAGPHYEVGWEDVWLSWRGKPGRRWYYAAPMIASRSDLEGELYITRKCALENPGLDFSDEIGYSERMLGQLDNAPYAADDTDCPNVYTNADVINRAEAERMLAWFLRERHGIKNPKFAWRKSKHGYATPVSFAGISQACLDASEAERAVTPAASEAP